MLAEGPIWRSEEHTSELQSQSNLVCRLLLEKKKNQEDGRQHRRLPVVCARGGPVRNRYLVTQQARGNAPAGARDCLAPTSRHAAARAAAHDVRARLVYSRARL